MRFRDASSTYPSLPYDVILGTTFAVIIAPMKVLLSKGILLFLIFVQIGLPVTSFSQHMDPRDPLIKYQNDAESLEQGALMGAALYLTSKLLGETIGDTAFAVKLRSYLPFMEYIIPPKGWRGWKEEIWNFAGYSVTGAAIGSFGASGVLAQQLEIGFTDAMNHYFLMQITEYFGNQTFRNDVPFIDMVMIKTASQIIRDELIPAGVPAFRGQTKEVLVLNGVTELTAYALIGAVEGASIAAVQKHVRNREVSAEDFIKNMSQHAATRGFEALNTIVFLGPRLHVSDREKEKIQAYAEAQYSEVEGEHAQILVVDDDKNTLDVLSHVLDAWGFAAFTAENGAEAIEKLQQNPGIVLVLLDLRLPDRGGMELLREIKEIRPVINVIMMSALADREVARQAINMGAFDYVAKPIELAALRSEIIASLGQAEYQKQSWWKRLIS